MVLLAEALEVPKKDAAWGGGLGTTGRWLMQVFKTLKKQM